MNTEERIAAREAARMTPSEGGSALADVLERVRAAKGPDRELDSAIWCAVGCPTPGLIAQDEHPEPRRQGRKLASHVPAYTASVDAALALVGRVLPGTYGRVEPRFFIDGDKVRWRGYTIRPRWIDYTPDDDWFDVSQADGPTPALALLAALFRALQDRTS